MLRLILLAAVALAVTAEDLETSFSCDFERDTCGVTNQEDLPSQWVRKKVNLGGREGYVMAVETKGERSQFARMMTPYFEIERTIDACLIFELYLNGDGAIAYHVEQQDNSGFHSMLSAHTPALGWRKHAINTTIDEYSRFLFEGHTYPALGKSDIAVDNFELNLKRCEDKR